MGPNALADSRRAAGAGAFVPLISRLSLLNGSFLSPRVPGSECPAEADARLPAGGRLFGLAVDAGGGFRFREAGGLSV